MNILKHMEAAFIVALAVAGTAGYVAGASEAPVQLASNIATPTKMAVVTVTAKRPTPVQKLQLLLAERIAASRA